ncbi:MAG TPA: efflux RND transporter periplasmic adaptor subunit [Anaeromyxobacter sp.]|nr:efflux RND transporter periplasmic adaptor subunit [Anaeromyxobacter sp.]
MKTKTKLWIAIPLGLLLVVAALGFVKARQFGTMMKAGEHFAPPPEAVSSAPVEEARWTATRMAIGTLVAVRGVTMGSELPGLITEIHFDSGSSVKQGSLMVKLDTSTEEAQLESAKADDALAKLSLERAQRLRKEESNSAADLDAAVARAKQTGAAVANLEALIAKKYIRAPFDGRVAIRQVELGQVLAAGAPVASIQSVTPIYADFWFPQQALADLRLGQKARLRTDTFPKDSWNGQISAINPEVDPATRNVKVRAIFGNPDGRLRPGMYANVEVLSSEQRKVLCVPVTAVLFAPYGDTVFVVEKKAGAEGKESLIAKQEFVRLGEKRGDFVEVLSGLEAGQTVVTSGAFKLRNGAVLLVNNALAPDAKLEPAPSER